MDKFLEDNLPISERRSRFRRAFILAQQVYALSNDDVGRLWRVIRHDPTVKREDWDYRVLRGMNAIFQSAHIPDNVRDICAWAHLDSGGHILEDE